jgi:hypothetical protein
VTPVTQPAIARDTIAPGRRCHAPHPDSWLGQPITGAPGAGEVASTILG